MSISNPTWWGDIALDLDAAAYWRIGPLQFTLERKTRSWNLSSIRNREPESTEFEVAVPGQRELVDAESLRLQFTRSPEKLSLQPVLSDRPVVVRTEAPIRLVAGEEVCFYLTTIMRLALKHGKQLLTEIPVYDLKDTWFGTLTYGELCYASTTAARTNFAALPERAYRPVTPVTVINKTRQTLAIDKFKLPVPSLALYTTPNGRLFTDGIRVVFDSVQDEVEVSVANGANAELPRASTVARPRQTISRLQTFTMGSFFK